MISDRRRAWIKDKLHGYFVRKLPNVVRLSDMLKKPFRKQIDHLLDDNFHDKMKTLRRRVFPYFLAYIAGCCAPEKDQRSKHQPARTS